jgi:hypothetical protein
MAGKPDSIRLTVAELVDKLRRSARTKRAGSNRSTPGQTPELQFSFLVGAGFSLGAGMLSTPELVSAMQIHDQHPDLPLDEVFDQARKLG